MYNVKKYFFNNLLINLKIVYFVLIKNLVILYNWIGSSAPLTTVYKSSVPGQPPNSPGYKKLTVFQVQIIILSKLVFRDGTQYPNLSQFRILFKHIFAVYHLQSSFRIIILLYQIISI